jgi:hypothetical protein
MLAQSTQIWGHPFQVSTNQVLTKTIQFFEGEPIFFHLEHVSGIQNYIKMYNLMNNYQEQQQKRKLTK